jgi:hypothetical protein
MFAELSAHNRGAETTEPSWVNSDSVSLLTSPGSAVETTCILRPLSESEFSMTTLFLNLEKALYGKY